MYHRLAKRLGVNYFWGLANFTAGAILSAAYSSFLLGLTHHGR